MGGFAPEVEDVDVGGSLLFVFGFSNGGFTPEVEDVGGLLLFGFGFSDGGYVPATGFLGTVVLLVFEGGFCAGFGFGACSTGFFG